MNFQTQLVIICVLCTILLLSFPEILYLIRSTVGKRKIKRYAEKHQFSFEVRKIKFSILSYHFESKATGMIDGHKVRIGYSQSNYFRNITSMLTVTLNGENPTRSRLSIWPGRILFEKIRPYFKDGWDATFKVDSRPMAFGKHVFPLEIRKTLYQNASTLRKRITVHVQRDGIVIVSIPTSRASVEMIDTIVQTTKEISYLAAAYQATKPEFVREEMEDPNQQGIEQDPDKNTYLE